MFARFECWLLRFVVVCFVYSTRLELRIWDGVFLSVVATGSSPIRMLKVKIRA